MFLVDTSPSMGTLRTIDLPPGPDGECRTANLTNLEWALQFIKLKIQEMIFNGRKTDQCGVIVFGSEETNNIVNEKNGGYENVIEYIPIGQPNAGTLAKIDALQPSSVSGDPIDALIVGIETQANYLSSKKTWTRKVIMVTDGESPIEVEDWEATVAKMDGLDVSLTIVGVDFDDEELPYTEPNKTIIKRANEEFYSTLTSTMKSGVLGSCAFALRETTRPEIKQTRSTLMGTVLRLGDVDTRGKEAIEIVVKTSKCTALTRPKSWKKFGVRPNNPDKMNVDEETEENNENNVVYSQLRMRTEYYVDPNADNEEDEEGDVKMEEEDGGLDEGEKDNEKSKGKDQNLQRVDREELVRGFKYGTTYVPCPEGQFPKLPTRKGIDICGFFYTKNFRRELSMGEIQYVWADPSSPQQQVAISSIVQAMYEKEVMAIARWVTKDGMDPKMGVLWPTRFDKVDCLLWSHMPFADDVRKYTFASLDQLVSKKGEAIKEHPYIPTKAQITAMDEFVDAMDLMDAGEKDEEGSRLPWFDTLLSYNPAVHRTKQAIFHSAVVSDIETNPLPPPHPDLVKYFEPPKRVLKRARGPLEECKSAFKVKQVPKKIAKAKKEGHVHARDEDDMLLLDRKQPALDRTSSQSRITVTMASSSRTPVAANDSDTEDDDDAEFLLDKKNTSAPAPLNKRVTPLPTPARSVSPQVDLGREPGRIIGATYPLKDFEKNVSQGDLISKAVNDLGAVITEIVMRPFASRRTTELLDCMQAMRKTSLEEDEIDAWNAFLTSLKKKCLSRPGNEAFWLGVKKSGRGLGLISTKEARQQGGISSISEGQAEEFFAI